MATKEEIVAYVKLLGEQKVLTREELDVAFDSGAGVQTPTAPTRRAGIAEILYYIGGGIVFLGIAIFISQNWSTLGFGTRVLATLGSAIAAYIVGVLFSRDERTETVGSAFYLISALVMPIGLFVVFENAGLDMGNGMYTLISAILLGTYGVSYLVFQKNVFMLFSILFGTGLFFNVTSLIIGEAPYFDPWKFYQYRLLVVGLSYMLLGHAFSKNKHASLSGFLYGFGIFGFLASALTLGGWQPNQNVFWELMFPGIVFGVIFLSVYLKSKSFLTWGSLFLMAYILKITSEYFSRGFGWSLSLVIAGLSMIGVGYMSLSLKRKYLSV